jgi:hypothetical protein
MITPESETEFTNFEQRIEDLLGHTQDLENRNQDLENRNQEPEYVCYTLHGAVDSQTLTPLLGRRNSRSEYGLEIILIVAFLHDWIGISLDHVCTVLQFFTGLDLPKSQADSLLNQLSTNWSE